MKFELEPQKTGAKKQLVPCLSFTRSAICCLSQNEAFIYQIRQPVTQFSLPVTCLECKYWPCDCSHNCDCSHKARSETAEEFDIYIVNSVVPSRRDIHTSSFTAVVCLSDSMEQNPSSNAVVSASQILPIQVHPEFLFIFIFLLFFLFWVGEVGCWRPILRLYVTCVWF